MTRKTISSSPHASFLRRERKNDKSIEKFEREELFQAKRRSACLKKHKKESHKRSKKKTRREKGRAKSPSHILERTSSSSHHGTI